MKPEEFSAWLEVVKGSACTIVVIAVGLAIAARVIYKIIRGHFDHEV